MSYHAQVAGQTIFDGGICESKAALVLRGRSAAVDGIVFQTWPFPMAMVPASVWKKAI